MTTATDTLDNPIRSHNETLSATWSSPGGAYDEVSRGILDAIEHCANRLTPPRGGRALDVATGTGWAARRLAERGVRVTGVDFAPEMLAAAKEMAGARNLDISFELGDAEALPYPDASFDAVISSFGIMFVQRPEDAAAEIARVCRPGGRIALAIWTPDGKVFAMFKIMKAYIPKPTGTPPPSPFEWGSRERLTTLLGNHFDLAFEQGTSFYREPGAERVAIVYRPRSLRIGLEIRHPAIKQSLLIAHDCDAAPGMKPFSTRIILRTSFGWTSGFSRSCWRSPKTPTKGY